MPNAIFNLTFRSSMALLDSATNFGISLIFSPIDK